MDEKLYRMDGNSVSPVSYSFFDTEDKLQALIAENPDLLLHELYSAEDISAGRRLFLIGREIGLRKSADDSTSMWLDVLFVDDSGLPVLVEVKRSVNPEIHRLVVAQLINYATFARLWNKSLLQNGFRQNNRADVLAEYDTDSFWDTVLTHLREETYTMVVAADKINGELAHLMFAIPACKGIEFGAGFGFAAMHGSEANDPFTMRDGKIATATNKNGGINGGITNGMPIVFRTVLKPTPSIYKQQHTVDYIGRTDAELQIKGRHDPCIVPRAAVVQNSLTAFGLLDLLTVRYGTLAQKHGFPKV